MSRKTVNILMLLLAVVYTVFIVAQLVLTVNTNESEYRIPIILVLCIGVLGGAWLIWKITRHLFKKSECGHRLRRYFSKKKNKKG